jgi:phospholipid/cholesterol/gamma-HCH transport system permease protein
MVMAAQTYFQFKKVQMETAVGPVVSLSMIREIGPVFAALMVAGRVGAAIAAELGTMKVTEQVEALRAFGTHPVDFLVVPRFIALLGALPLLTGAVMLTGILCGRFVAANLFGIDKVYFDANMLKYTHASDVVAGLIKAGFFAIFVSMISCYKGLNCTEGAEGVGRATTEAVVVSSITILISNFFITYLLSFLIPP